MTGNKRFLANLFKIRIKENFSPKSKNINFEVSSIFSLMHKMFQNMPIWAKRKKTTFLKILNEHFQRKSVIHAHTKVKLMVLS